MNIEEFPDDSDSSDEDYIPERKPEEPVSEVDSDGEPEDPLSDKEDAGSRRGQKRKRRTKKAKRKLKKDNSSDDEENEQKTSEETEQEKKKNYDDLWADFMKDTGFKPKNSTAANTSTSSTTAKPKTSEKKVEKPPVEKKQEEKVKIVQIFEFAGEEVKVEKQVSANSAEGRLLANASTNESKSGRGAKRPAVRSGGLSGISNVLSQLGKKQKISTLEKSKLDWDKFKKEENLEEELSTYNKGKDGYLARQDFLQEVDLRQFEIERETRAIERSKRQNNTL